MRILLCTNGTPHTARALELGTYLAKAIATEVDILVIGGDEREREAQQLAESTATELELSELPVTIYRRVGRMRQEIVTQAQSKPYGLVVIGSRGRKGMVRLLFGSVAIQVTEDSPASVLVVKGRHRRIRRILVCSAAGPVSEETIMFAGRLAKALGSSVTILHVMSQLPVSQEALLHDLEATAEDLIERGSREGAHLNRMLEQLAEEGMSARAVVRHGLVIDEIVAETQEGCYDLLVTGSHITPGVNAKLVDDLRADILLAVNRPVLVVRGTIDEDRIAANPESDRSNPAD